MKNNTENRGSGETQPKNLKEELKQRNISFEEKKADSSTIISFNSEPNKDQGKQNSTPPNDQKGK